MALTGLKISFIFPRLISVPTGLLNSGVDDGLLSPVRRNAKKPFIRSPPMIQKRLVSAVIVPVLFACGCSSMSDTEKGVGLGGLLGAGTGALIGHATGHTGAGALIGAGVGAVSGGLIGNAVDESEQRQAAIAAANAPRGPLGITDVAQLAQAHVSDAVI